MIHSIAFILLFFGGIALFLYQMADIRKTIALGRPEEITGNTAERWKNVVLVAFGQKKMFKEWFPALMHFFVYAAFLITQIELVEIIVDGIIGSHRIARPFLGGLYTFIVSFIEVLSVLAFVATLIFLARRNLLKVPRFQKPEMKGWPKLDGNIILYLEILLIVFIFMMNGADEVLYNRGQSHAVGTEHQQGSFGFTVSQFVGQALFGGISDYHTLELIERIGWWGHIMVVLIFLNYLPISKHFHILMAFPNVFYSRLDAKGRLTSSKHIQEEVKAAFDFSYTPPEDPNAPKRFGAKDITDLTWKSLMDSYTCTECGRCSAVCPANLTGKKLSPRKIVMDTRDRLEEIRKFKLVPNEEGLMIPGNGVEGAEEAAGHTLLGHYISEEELRACTTCNACVEACPVNIDQLSIIVELRRHLILEDSSMPEEWASMTNNIENNGAPWAFPAADRFNWSQDIEPLGPSNQEVDKTLDAS
ncbi:MAG: (Fe-S)-binding protein [Bacteroidota bacterium]